MPVFAITDNLNWEVEPRPMFYPNAQGELVRSNKVAIVRSDTDTLLGEVSPEYEIVQNRDLLRIIEPMIEEGVLEIKNMGYLSGGAKVFAQAEIAKEYMVIGEEYKAFITLLNGHIGNQSVAIGPSNIRVICNNTYTMAYSSIEGKFRHSEGVNGRILETTEVIKFIDSSMAAYNKKAETIATSPCSMGQFHKFVEGIYGKPVKELKDSVISSLNQQFYEGVGTEGKTFYDAFNAITYMNSHGSKALKSNFKYVNFGKGNDINRRAMKVALEMASV